MAASSERLAFPKNKFIVTAHHPKLAEPSVNFYDLRDNAALEQLAEGVKLLVELGYHNITVNKVLAEGTF